MSPNIILAPSPDFVLALKQCEIFHATRKVYSGKGILKHAVRIFELADEIDARSMLDFGCGKGGAYGPDVAPSIEGTLGFPVTKYDPAVPEFSAEPQGKFDLVVCCDVLECVPEGDIDYMVQRLGDLTAKALFVTVATFPSKKTLPDGRNAHLTQKPEEWWMERFAPLRRRRGANAIHVELRVE